MTTSPLRPTVDASSSLPMLADRLEDHASGFARWVGMLEDTSLDRDVRAWAAQRCLDVWTLVTRVHVQLTPYIAEVAALAAELDGPDHDPRLTGLTAPTDKGSPAPMPRISIARAVTSSQGLLADVPPAMEPVG